MNKFKIGVIQLSISSDKEKNLNNALRYIEKLSSENVDLVVLPEMFNCPYEKYKFPIYAEYDNGSTFSYLSSIAKKYNIYLVGGSIPEKDESDKVYNTSYVFNRCGELIAKHRKIHLFDVHLKNGQQFKESDTISPGEDVTVFDTEFGKIGLCICFDFRFPELSMSMIDKGAKAIIVPASFNMTTGPIHWELLFKCRAVDNQAYTIGCSSARDTSSKYVSYGHSLAVSPWGDIIANTDEKEGYFICDLDFDYVDKIRKELPLLSHRRTDLY